MLLVALSFACMGIYEWISKSGQLSWLSPSIDDGYPPHFVWIVNVIYSVLIFAVPAFIYTNAFPLERFAYFRLNTKIPKANLLFGAVAMILLFPLFNEIVTIIKSSVTITNQEFLDLIKENDKIEAWAIQMPGIGSLFLCLLANALVPAICEELFFRAGVQQILMERNRTFFFHFFSSENEEFIKHRSILATALLFTFFHFDIFSSPVIFIGGMVLGYAFYWSGSLLLTILMHFMFNATSLIIEYTAQHNASVRAWEPGILVAIPTTIMSGGLLFLLWKRTADSKI